MESDQIRADAIEAIEFPHLVVKYQVAAVPRIVINETYYIDGAIPEPPMIGEVLKALGKEMGQATAIQTK